MPERSPDLTLRFAKKSDGDTVIDYRRPDGTSTWARNKDAFFVLHDFTHYAVETTLGLRRAFFGLLAEGWNLEDFGTPWPRGPIPPEAMPEASLAEHLAGSLDRERYADWPLTAADFNQHYAAACGEAGIVVARVVTEEDIDRVRALRGSLEARWLTLPFGGDMELTFSR